MAYFFHFRSVKMKIYIVYLLQLVSNERKTRKARVFSVFIIFWTCPLTGSSHFQTLRQICGRYFHLYERDNVYHRQTELNSEFDNDQKYIQFTGSLKLPRGHNKDFDKNVKI